MQNHSFNPRLRTWQYSINFERCINARCALRVLVNYTTRSSSLHYTHSTQLLENFFGSYYIYLRIELLCNGTDV